MAGHITKQLDETLDSEGELECEEIIMNEKERFGRVRTSMMKNLR